MTIGKIAILVAFLLFLLVAGAGSTTMVVLMIKQSLDRRGNWGFNLRPEDCPRCGQRLPTVRRPRNLRQAVWGGWTCERCGVELDKWGRPVGGSDPGGPPQKR